MSELIQSLECWIDYRDHLLASGQTIGFVATMGALHEGHLELISRARAETDCVVVSVFVNPTQFDDPEDLERYPKSLDDDQRLAATAGANVVFAPTSGLLYPDNYSFQVAEMDFSSNLEGEHRPGHFEGVLTVVMKLLNLIKPTRAYFGEKDYQQLKLIEGMARAFFLDVEIIPVAIVRESDGLALSSRNVHLSEEGRKKAPEFHRSLVQTTTTEEVRRDLEGKGFTVEYVEEIGHRRLGAVVLENIRLIDNVPI